MSRIKNKPFITYILLGIMLVVFLIMTLSGGTSDPVNLFRFGAKYNPAIRAGEYWRFITPIFIHIGFTHILMNGITLYFIGQYVEMIFGHWRYLIIFFVSGIMGNLASFAFNYGLSAGSSTAIFGLFGAFVMLGDSFKKNPVIVSQAKTFIAFIALNLVFDLFSSGIDIAGHLGGLVGGFLIAYVTGVHFAKTSRVKRIISIIALIVIACFLFYYGFYKNV